jgi:hypothetical protein
MNTEETFTKYEHKIFSDQEIDRQLEKLKSENLRVWYGVRRLGKIVKKRSIIVIFENEVTGLLEKNEKKVKLYMDIAHVRLQTEAEKTDAAFKNRVFHTFEIYFDNKKYKGDYMKALEDNSLADQHHVSITERELIKTKLSRLLKEKYDLYTTQSA